MKLLINLYLSLKSFRFLYIVIFIFLSIPSFTFSEYSLSANSIKYLDNSFIAKGDVSILVENNEITSDELVGQIDSNIIQLNGNVNLISDQYSLYSDSIQFDHFANTGCFYNANIEFDRLLINASKINQSSNSLLNLVDAKITTCTNATPHYLINVKNAQIIDNNSIMLKNAFLNIHNIPIIYLPYIKYNLNDPNNLEFKTKYSNNLGYSLLLNPKYIFDDNLIGNTGFNYFSERGVGISQNLEFSNKNAKSDLSLFYIRDDKPYNRYNSVNEKKLISSDRFYLDFTSDYFWTNEKYFKTKVSYLSDKYLKEEFFRDDYIREIQPENYLSGVFANEIIGGEIYVNNRLNNFYSNLNKAEISANIYRCQIADSPIYYNSKNAISYLDLLDYNNLVLNETLRLYSRNELHLPLKIGYLNFIPKIYSGYSFYSKTLTNSNFDNFFIGSGFETSMSLHKILHTKDKWYGKGLKHSLKPFINYSYNKNSSFTNDIFRYENLDTYLNDHVIKLGLNNLFLTKRDNKISRLCEIDIYTVGNKEDNLDLDYENLFVDGRISLKNNLNFDYLANFNISNGDVPIMISRLNYIKSDFNLSFSQYELNTSSLISTRIEIFPKSSLSFDSYIRYEYEESKFENAGFTAYFNDCCTRYGVGYRLGRGGNSHQVLFSINLLELDY